MRKAMVEMERVLSRVVPLSKARYTPMMSSPQVSKPRSVKETRMPGRL